MISLARLTLLIRAVVSIIWGILLLAFGPIPCTELSWIMTFAGSAKAAGLILVASGIAVSTVLLTRIPSILLFIVLILSFPIVLIPAVGSVQQVIAQHYADMTPRPWQFILAGQSNTIVASIVQSVSIIWLFRREREWSWTQRQ